jgi:hypothetical protein
MTKNFSGFDSMFTNTVEEKKQAKSTSEIKPKPTTYYLHPDLTKKLEIIGFYKRKKSISKHLEELIQKEIDSFGKDKFKEALEIFMEEHQEQKDFLKKLKTDSI